MQILGISGSLNSQSSNTRLLRALRGAAAPDLDIVVYESLDTIPPFSPDRDTDPAPAPVSELRTMVCVADALLLSTPEYAGGMPGTLKNALDWLVGSGELYGKAVVILSAAPSEHRGHNARQSLEFTLRMQGAQVCDSFTVPVAPQSPDESLAADRAGVLARTIKAFVGPKSHSGGYRSVST